MSDPTVVVALGDLMLTADRGSAATQERALRSLRDRLGAATPVFANLETTLAGSEGEIAKEPRLVASRDAMAAALRALRPELVCLANNHAFDAYASGFTAVLALLDELGIRRFGAGFDAAKAAEPAITTIGSVTLGWLGYVAADTHPSHVAGARTFGANPLEPERAREQIAALRPQVDHVLVSLHWGAEYCHLPSPAQIVLARSLVDAGATAVLGHHAHVIQGVETHGRGLVAFGLGNAITTDLRIRGRLAIKQSRRTNSALALRLTLDRERLVSYEPIPYRVAAGEARLHDPYARGVLERASRALADGVSETKWRKQRRFEDLVLRPLWKLDPRVIRSLNAGHVRKLFQSFAASVRLQSR